MPKVAHWVLFNNSGMNNVAKSLCEAEKVLGIESTLANFQDASEWERVKDYDIHVCHTHCPPEVMKSGKPVIWVAHGTPEVMFYTAYDEGLINGSYGHSDAWMLAQYWLQNCDVTVTFWPRHHAIWKSLCDKKTRVECIPLGVDKSFWKPQPTQGKFAGSPSLFSAENQYKIKWSLDLFTIWPWVVKNYSDARLHVIYLPKDQHRWWFPLVNRNGASFNSHISAMVFSNEQLRNAFCSNDFYIGLVRYGDANRISLEANASGAKTISYRGNIYSDYWITEGDQRIMAQELNDILSGQVEPRAKEPVPTIEDTAKALKTIYESL